MTKKQTTPFHHLKHTGDVNQLTRLALLEHREIIFQGQSGDELNINIVSQLRMLNRLDPKAPITFLIQNGGGYIKAAFAIIDTINAIEAPVHMLAIGDIYSCGTLIFAAGEKGFRTIAPNCDALVHAMTTGIGTQKIDDVMSDAYHSKRVVEARLVRHLAMSCGRTTRQIRKDLKKENWMSPKEAVSYGLADKVGYLP